MSRLVAGATLLGLAIAVRLDGVAKVQLRPRMPTRTFSVLAGHVCGQDVVAVSVEVVPSSVVFRGRSRVRVAGSDLHVAQRYARVEHGGDVGVSQRMRVDPMRDRALPGQPFDDSVCAAAGHPATVTVPKDRALGSVGNGGVDVSRDVWRQRDRGRLAALADDV
jgi:hypothetical protein